MFLNFDDSNNINNNNNNSKSKGNKEASDSGEERFNLLADNKLKLKEEKQKQEQVQLIATTLASSTHPFLISNYFECNHTDLSARNNIFTTKTRCQSESGYVSNIKKGIRLVLLIKLKRKINLIDIQ